jgi:hypothetical protein
MKTLYITSLVFFATGFAAAQQTSNLASSLPATKTTTTAAPSKSAVTPKLLSDQPMPATLEKNENAAPKSKASTSTKLVSESNIISVNAVENKK